MKEWAGRAWSRWLEWRRKAQIPPWVLAFGVTALSILVIVKLAPGVQGYPAVGIALGVGLGSLIGLEVWEFKQPSRPGPSPWWVRGALWVWGQIRGGDKEN